MCLMDQNIIQGSSELVGSKFPQALIQLYIRTLGRVSSLKYPFQLSQER